jgi:hypothetical protein
MNSKAASLAGAFLLPLLVTAVLTRILLYVVLQKFVPHFGPTDSPLAASLGFGPIILGLGVGVPFASRLFRDRMTLWLLYWLLMFVALWVVIGFVAFLTIGIVE